MKTITETHQFRTELSLKEITQDLDFIPMDNFGVNLDAVIHWVLQQKMSSQGVEEETKIINKVVVDVTWVTENEDVKGVDTTQPNYKELVYDFDSCEQEITKANTAKPYELYIDNKGCTVMF